MKIYILTLIGFVILVSLVITGCTGEKTISKIPEGQEETASSCVTCHTDEELLKSVASVPEEEKSEATSGEG